MRAIDTNVLVRLITRDDAGEAAATDDFIEQGAWVSLVVLADAMWRLARFYTLRPEDLAKAIEMLLHHHDLVIQDAEAVAGALELFRSKPALGFSDCLILQLARKTGHLPLRSSSATLPGAADLTGHQVRRRHRLRHAEVILLAQPTVDIARDPRRQRPDRRTSTRQQHHYHQLPVAHIVETPEPS